MNCGTQKHGRIDLTMPSDFVYSVPRNTPYSFGEGARSRFERIGSCFSRRASP